MIMCGLWDIANHSTGICNLTNHQMEVTTLKSQFLNFMINTLTSHDKIVTISYFTYCDIDSEVFVFSY